MLCEGVNLPRPDHPDASDHSLSAGAEGQAVQSLSRRRCQRRGSGADREAESQVLQGEAQVGEQVR